MPETRVSPKKSCDLVMKGGITSGVVYPMAVVELAKEYRFECIGGTSAGAIAAVVTAAAEYGRESGGFELNRPGFPGGWFG
jgi:predicted acylesterase/phospholipase RssA